MQLYSTQTSNRKTKHSSHDELESSSAAIISAATEGAAEATKKKQKDMETRMFDANVLGYHRERGQNLQLLEITGRNFSCTSSPNTTHSGWDGEHESNARP